MEANGGMGKWRKMIGDREGRETPSRIGKVKRWQPYVQHGKTAIQSAVSGQLR